MRVSDILSKYRVLNPIPQMIFAVLGAFLMLFFQSSTLAQSIAQPGTIESSGKQDRLSAAPTAVVTVTAPNQFVTAGSNFNAPITTTDLSSVTTGVDVISYDITLTYNPAVIVPQSPAVSGTGTISENGAFTLNTSTPGTIIVSFFRADPLVGAGTLFNFRFTAVGPDPSTSPLTWTSFRFNEGNPDDNDINGLITIGGTTAAGATVSGRVTDQNGSPLRNVTISISDNNGLERSARSNPFGYYVFQDVPAGATYVISARSKQNTFHPRVINVYEDVVGADLIADQ